jgi:hypothetical protein
MIDNIQMDIANFGLTSCKPGWIVQAIIMGCFKNGKLKV